MFNDCVSNVCESVHKKFLPAALILHPVEEVKWMDGPSVTEMDRGGVYEMDKKKVPQKWKCHQNGYNFIRFLSQVIECFITIYPFQ